jgi:hypothetical protein
MSLLLAYQNRPTTCILLKGLIEQRATSLHAGLGNNWTFPRAAIKRVR